LGRAVGAAGLVGGQVTLSQKERPDVSIETLNFIHNHKTAALLKPVWFVVGFWGAPAADLKRLSGYAQNIGLAFQIVDDILDITATQEELRQNSWEGCKRKSNLSVWGWKPQRQAQQLIEAASGN